MQENRSWMGGRRARLSAWRSIVGAVLVWFMAFGGGAQAAINAADQASLDQSLQSWAQAWSAGRVDDYLGHYGDDFVPGGGLTRAQWEAQRRQRVGPHKPVKVGLDAVQWLPSGVDEVRAVFRQSYASGSYRDQSHKLLLWARQGTAWKIMEEISEADKGQPPPAAWVKEIAVSISAAVPEPVALTAPAATAQQPSPEPAASVAELVPSPAVPVAPVRTPSPSVAPQAAAVVSPPPPSSPAPTVRAQRNWDAEARALVERWKDAWERRDVEMYLASYSPNFEPSGNLSRANWVAQRKQRLGKQRGVTIGVDQLQVGRLSNGELAAVFVQEFRSARIADRDLKTLRLENSGDGLLIVGEEAEPYRGQEGAFAVLQALEAVSSPAAQDRSNASVPVPAPHAAPVLAPRAEPVAVGPTGAVRIDSVPVGATVLLNGHPVGVTPWRSEAEAVGNHQVTVLLADHEAQEFVLNVLRGKTANQTVRLKSSFGVFDFPDPEVRWTLVPESSEADYQAAGIERGASFSGASRLKAGAHTLQYSRKGFAPLRQQVQIKAGETTRIDPAGLPWQRLRGVLDVTVSNGGAATSVWVDGRRVGTAPLKIEWPVGETVVRAEDGARDGEVTVEVKANATAFAVVALDWRAGTTYRDCPECPVLVVVPAGKFIMGSDEHDADERPAHEVQLKRFALGQREVTEAEWQRVMGEPALATGCADCPRTGVSVPMAEAFLAKLKERTGKLYRFPSEAEWEYACRAGESQSTCGSDRPDAVAWYGATGAKTAQPVARKEPNRFGLHDMSGNVWEWTADCWNGDYAGAPVDGSAWRSGQCGLQVLRGGSWSSGANALRPSLRFRYHGNVKNDTIGLRVARSLE